MSRLAACALACALALALAGCAGSTKSREELRVFSVSALQRPLDAYAAAFERSEHADVQLTYGRADRLAERIRDGITPGLFIADDRKLQLSLFGGGEVQQPVIVAAGSERPPTYYVGAVLVGTGRRQQDLASAFMAGLTSGAGRDELRKAGFRARR